MSKARNLLQAMADQAMETALDEQRERIAKLEEALRFYADPSKAKDEYGDPVQVPDFYSELDFGSRAVEALGDA